MHADAPFFGVVVVEAGAEVLAPAEGNAAVGDEKPVGGGRGDGEVFFAEVGEGGGELDGVGGAGVAVEPLPEGGRVQKFDFAVVDVCTAQTVGVFNEAIFTVVDDKKVPLGNERVLRADVAFFAAAY